MIRELALKIAFAFIGKPYIWGGNDPVAGFDCSGFAVEILKSVGILPRKGDWTAQDLANKWPKIEKPTPGSLIFWDWNGDGKIDHVEIIFDINDNGNFLTIGSSDGGSKTLTEKDAILQDAYIKIRPAREGQACIVDPFIQP